MERGFQRPKVFDPSLADRQVAFSSPVKNGSNSVAFSQSSLERMRDLGFEDEQNPKRGVHDYESSENFRELSEQLEEAQRQLVELKSSVEDKTAAETRSQMKLKSFQQVNRSQSTLMKAELQKTRRRLNHMQAVASRLRDQVEFFQSLAPTAVLPPELQGLPAEDEANDDDSMIPMQKTWENDIIQLQTLLLKECGGDSRSFRSPSPPISEGATGMADEDDVTVEVAKQRIQELAAVVRKQKKDAECYAAEIQQFRTDAIDTATATSGGTAALRQELEASEEKVKEQQKKLKQLAVAYKKLEQEKKEIAENLKKHDTSGEIMALQSIRKTLAENKSQVQALKSEVNNDFNVLLPSALEKVLRDKLPELQQICENSSKTWKDKYTVECEKRRKLHNLVQELKGNIRVYCRVRPMNQNAEGNCISFPSPDEIQIRNEDTGTKKAWTFNLVLGQDSSQQDLFEGIRDLVVSMLDGYNVCIFAYGQTGSGKTHSMQGTPENPGMYRRTFLELFKVISERLGWKVDLSGALLEVYNEEIRDLLADPNDTRKPKLQIKQTKEGGNSVAGIVTRPVRNADEVEDMLAIGSVNRTTAATDMNLHSSRSHLLVQIMAAITTPEGKKLNSIITLVDLAGSERLAKSGVTGDRARETIAINKSLSALSDVINARASKSTHTPYRNSTLTHLLQDSLGGDAKNLMLLQINPCKDHVEESMCSLQFGARVNSVEMTKK